MAAHSLYGACIMIQGSAGETGKEKIETPKRYQAEHEQHEEGKISDPFDFGKADGWNAIYNKQLSDEQQILLAELADIWTQIDFIDVPHQQEKCVYLLRLASSAIIFGNHMNLATKLKEMLERKTSRYFSRNSNPLVSAIRAFIFGGVGQPLQQRILLRSIPLSIYSNTNCI